jgi:two-component system response regulator AtoC
MSEEPARVLIIDDEQAFGEMVSEVLGDSGYETVLATDPAAALERVPGGGFAVAVVDLVMPGMGGLQVAEKIKAASPETEVLILTGHADIAPGRKTDPGPCFDWARYRLLIAAETGN